MIEHLISRKKATELTGFSLTQFNALCRKGIVRIIKLNQRVFMVPDSDLIDLPAKILAYERQQALADMDSENEISRATMEGLRKFYGNNIPGMRQ